MIATAQPELILGTPTATDALSIVTVRQLRKIFHRKKSNPEASGWSRLWQRTPTEEFVAVSNVSFDIAQGEIFGLLGPNGAGKSTTIRMLCTLLAPTMGSAQIAGYDIVRQASQVRQSLGAVLTGERSIYWKLTGRENLEYFAALYHLPPSVARERITRLLDRLGLTDRADEAVERYSSGMKQRIAIAKALLANPPVVLLDEPTIGLDPQSARNLRELIWEIKEEGRTILLTTHYMEEADQLSDRIGIIDSGRVIALDTPSNLKRSIDQLDLVQLEVEDGALPLVATLARLDGVRQTTHRDCDDGAVQHTLYTPDSRSVLPRAIALIGEHGGRIRHLQLKQATLEDVFIALTGKTLRD